MAYSDEQRAEALAVYAAEGLPAAAKHAGCDKATILRWAEKAGVEPPQRCTEQTAAATAEHIAVMREKKQQLRTELADRALEMLARMAEPETDHKGQNAKEVVYDRATAPSCARFATAAAILIDKLEIVGWADGESSSERAGRDLERMRAEAVARGEHLTAVA